VVQLRAVDGELTLGSAYKLFFVGWLFSWSVLVGVTLLFLVLLTVVTGQVAVNDEMVYGTGPALRAMLPILVLFPPIVVFQAFIFAGFLTFGIWLYRLRRPLLVIADTQATVA
jgi:hypothetical protein